MIHDDCGFGWCLVDHEPDPIEIYEAHMDDTCDTWEDATRLGELRAAIERGHIEVADISEPDDSNFTYARQEINIATSPVRICKRKYNTKQK